MLNVTFVGGGSLRLLPIVRSLFRSGQSLHGGSIRLCDLALDRAEAVGRMIESCPEFKGTDCRVSWTDNLDEALEGSDLLYVTMAIERQPELCLSQSASVRHGFMHSDQLSLNGAFLSALGGPMMINFARKMERICPKAKMLIFANPVSVYAAMVNNHTSIKALGVCEGFGNHRWDIPRLLGRDEYDQSIKAVSCGVNHLAFITRGKWGERDLFAVLEQELGDDWAPMGITTCSREAAVQQGLRYIHEIYQRYGTLIFSSEGDGLGHIFWEDIVKGQSKTFKTVAPDQLEALAAESAEAVEQKFAYFMGKVGKADTELWNAPPLSRDQHLFGVSHTDIANPIFSALNGDGAFQIAASANNGGAVAGFDDRTALEYTMVIDGKTITPVADQKVPAPFYGLISSLAEYQTLLGDAIAYDDPKLFATALAAYPVGRFHSTTTAYLNDLFDIYTRIPKSLAAAKGMLFGND